MNFYPDQKIVARRDTHGPKDGEIVTVAKYSVNAPGYIQLKEYPGSPKVIFLFDERDFGELIEDSVLEAELKSIF